MDAPSSANDLRERVVRAHLAGKPIRSSGALRRQRFLGPQMGCALPGERSVAPDRMGGRRRHVMEPHRALVRALVGETPHLTIDRLRDLLAAQGTGVPGHDLAVPQARGAALQKKNSVRP